MHAFTTLLTFLAFAAVSVSAAPLHQRRTCRPHSQIAAVSSSAHASSTSVVTTASSAHATSTKVSSTQSSSKAASTKASSTKATSVKATSTKASSSATASAVAATSSSSSASSLLKKLFPVSHSAFWTTSDASPDALPLDDATFGVTNLLKALPINYVTAPDGKYSLKAFYPKGSYTFTHSILGGLSFYATGPSSVSLDNAKEATLSYSVYFEDGFDFNMGGKLPGFFGGDSFQTAVSCSGGRRDDGCFSTRFMWRTDGAGELYTYLPPDFPGNQNVCNVAPFSTCNDVYGASVGRGSFKFQPGTRTTIGQRVRLNDAGQSNGELELFVEGQSVFTVKGLVFRDSDAGRIRGIQMQTFFGGSEAQWASPKDQSTYFSDFSVAITETF
ncbi:polysaccharide lyase family 14 protein [Trametes coccinea BRFM310]|uniref:Polysaccharide lyase family 14 protein n=1 Tax=Trametes coccinea (strain BRFM310) TaxID=1353009 RepID=A0A1Y2IQ77_TRAC3|nr:polysaccharide lyase family 14 protein [Trametes coccinea BRFM310]